MSVMVFMAIGCIEQVGYCHLPLRCCWRSRRYFNSLSWSWICIWWVFRPARKAQISRFGPPRVPLTTLFCSNPLGYCWPKSYSTTRSLRITSPRMISVRSKGNGTPPHILSRSARLIWGKHRHVACYTRSQVHHSTHPVVPQQHQTLRVRHKLWRFGIRCAISVAL